MGTKDLCPKFQLADTLLQMWKYPYTSKWLMFAFNIITVRSKRGIPSPME